MLILRRELKVGLGIGGAILGIAAVYGLMSMLTGGSDKEQLANNGDTGTTDTLHVGDGARTEPETLVPGLPPKDTSTASTGTSSPTGGTGSSGSTGTAQTTTSDPFSESARTDGASANADKWTIMFNTGKVVNGATPAVGTPSGGNDTIVTRNPTERTAQRSPFETTTPREQVVGTDWTPTESRSGSPTSAAPAGGKYVVQSGDTFSSIAGKLYGNRNLYHHILKANPNVDPARLKPGTEIVVPAVDSVKSERSAITTPEPAITGAIDANKQYRVQAGDTLHKISQRLYGKTNQWMAIYDLNKSVIGPDAGKLKVGTLLALPQVPTQH